ncbi:Acetylcholine receptor subunit alpha [Mizuhopecten yessoensis]|uniref:Acetylcholine receptor subunit alpha n=1 Tax=Mizuhopecten yessoensis TaxID=6573 RepID=A0A210QMV7_MIZYE|nr:Acetylcholine receptor subunit alpha [Mizuhopecten yessoensis]
MKFNEFFVFLGTFIACHKIIYYVEASGTFTDRKRLMENVFTNYSKEMRPVENLNETLAIGTVFFPIAILDVDEVSGTIILTAGLCMFWTDFQLSWEPANYGGITEFVVNSSKIWTPSIFLMSSASDMEMFNLDQFRSRIYNNGKVSVCPGRKITSSCSVDMTNFPSDSQKCSVLIAVWGYYTSEIILSSEAASFYMVFFRPNGEWNLDETSAEEYLMPGNEVSIFAYNMVLSRKSTYFLLSMILPVYTLCFLNPFVFLLPAASGERISYTITMFLSLAVYMTLVGDNMPKVSEPMAGISYFLLVAMLFSCLLIILTIFTLRCDAVTDVTNFPKCVRRLVLKVKKNRKNTRKPITRNSVDVDSIEFGSKNVPSTSDVSTIELKKENGEQGINANDIDEPDKKDVTNCIDITLFFFAETVVFGLILSFVLVYNK